MKGRVPDAPGWRQAREALAAGDAPPGRLASQRLQETADRLRAWLSQATLAEAGPAGCLMSGSGTSCFALCRDEAEALEVVRGSGRNRANGDSVSMKSVVASEVATG